MKTKVIIAVLAVIVLLNLQVRAQTHEQSRIKILPSKTGMVKVLYAMQVSQPVVVKFFNSNGVLWIDKIKGPFETGFLKYYDVAKISDKVYRVEITSPNLMVRFRVEPSGDKRTFTSYLEKATSEVLVSYR